jgi:ubiquinol-cytochrome c reductase cytochrome c subunit
MVTSRRPAGWKTSRLALCVLVLVPLVSPLAFCRQTENTPSPDGAAIYSGHCAKCHGDKGQGISALISYAGPNIQAVHKPGTVMMAVETGPGHMPSFVNVLSVKQMRAVAHYITQQLAVIPLEGGNLSEGGTLFRANCAACHRTAARGGALAFTGINAPSLANFSAPLIAGAVRWGPGPMPAFPPSVLSNEQLNSIVKYVTFVQHPPNPGGNPLGYYGPVAEGFAGWVGVLVLIIFTIWIEKGGRG